MTFHTASDGCRIFYETAGAGAPLVLIPGLGGDGRFWNGVVEHVRGNFRIITVDHRGAARSGRPDQGYSIARIAEDVVGILDQEGIQRAHIAGHSTGGAVAQVLAIDYGDRLLSCTISSSWLKPDARFRMLFGLRQDLLRQGKFESYQQLTHVLGFPPGWIESHQDELAAAVLKARETLSPVEIQIARINMLLAHDCERRASEISVPTLVIGADDDAMLPRDYSLHIVKRIPHSRMVTLSGGHFHPRTEPAAFAETLQHFIGSLP